MSDFRESGAVIREAELLAGTPEAAAAWIKERSSQSWYFWAEGDQHTETALLGMGSRLIDLALARYGRNAEVLRELYCRDDLPLRAAVLSNEPHLQEAIFGPWEFTGSARDDFGWLARLSDTEFQALFANPALPNNFISDFFEQKGAWVVLDDEHRRAGIAWMARNLGSRREKNSWDSWENYSQSKVFYSAWQLAAHVPTTSEWAGTLAHLYDALPVKVFSKFHPLEIAKRWYPADDDDKTWNDEGGYEEKGSLSPYQRVRAGLARLAASAPVKTPRMDLLSDPDVAVRCGACAALRLEPDNITEAVARDGAVAAYALIENDSAWRNAKTREALRQACWGVPDPRSDMLVPQAYSQREQVMRERSPGWFADEDLLPEDVAEVSVSVQLGRLQQQLSGLQKTFAETQLLIVLGLAAGLVAYFVR